MNDDFNTANAVAVLFDLAREINRAKSEAADTVDALASLLKYLADIIGLLQSEPEVFLKSQVSSADGISDDEIEALIQQRLDARASKDWAEADRIRDELTSAGISIEDGAGSSRWRRA